MGSLGEILVGIEELEKRVKALEEMASQFHRAILELKDSERATRLLYP